MSDDPKDRPFKTTTPEEDAGKIADQAPTFTGGAPRRRSQPRTTFTVPAKVRDPDRDPTTITIEELTAGQEMDAYAAADGNRQRVASELAQRSIRGIDGREVNDDDMMVAWGSWSAKMRQLAILAYGNIHTTPDDVDQVFLNSAVRD